MTPTIYAALARSTLACLRSGDNLHWDEFQFNRALRHDGYLRPNEHAYVEPGCVEHGMVHLFCGLQAFEVCPLTGKVSVYSLT
jgi:hypothetical protein